MRLQGADNDLDDKLSLRITGPLIKSVFKRLGGVEYLAKRQKGRPYISLAVKGLSFKMNADRPESGLHIVCNRRDYIKVRHLLTSLIFSAFVPASAPLIRPSPV